MTRPYALNSRKLKLSQLAEEVAREVEEATPQPLTNTQMKALYETLRFLDFRNHYEIGYQLRQAFEIELDDERGKDELPDQKVAAIEQAVTDYYWALDARKSGQIAQDKAFSTIEDVLGMSWNRHSTQRKKKANG